MLAVLLGLLSLPAASALQVGWPFMPREPPPFFAPPFFPFHNEPEGPPPPFAPTDESRPPPFLRLPLDFTRPRPPPFDRPHLRGSFLTGPFAGPEDQQRRRMGEEAVQEEGSMARDPFIDIFAAAREKLIERQRLMSTLASVLTSAVLELPSSLSLDPEDPNDMQRMTTEERTEPAVMSEEVDATKGGRVVVTGTRTPCSLRTVISYLYGPKAEVQEAGVGDEASPSVPASSGSEALTTSRNNVAAAAAEKAISRGVTQRRPIMATKQDSDMAADARAALDGTDAEEAVEVVKPQRNLDEAEAEDGEVFVKLNASAIPSEAAPRAVPTSVGGLLGMIVACVALVVVTVGAVIGLTHNRITQRRRNDRAAFERLYQPLLVDDGPGTAPEAVLA